MLEIKEPINTHLGEKLAPQVGLLFTLTLECEVVKDLDVF